MRFSYPTRCLAAAALTLLALCPQCVIADGLGWDFEPYRIQTLIALDVPGGLDKKLADELPAYLQRRAEAGVGLSWSLQVTLATGAVRQRMLSGIAEFSDTPPAELSKDSDKLILITLIGRPEGYELTAREYDRYVDRWGPTIRRRTQQEQSLPEQTFAILWQVVAPLARFDLDPDDESRVKLQLRGAALMAGDSSLQWVKPGDVFVPILRHTTRSGKLVEKGIQQVPWTYLESLPPKDKHQEGNHFARVHSGTRRPFGARRQGRVEQVAIGLRSDPDTTTIHLQSRIKSDKPLVGYEILFPAADEKVDAMQRLGTTDRSGNASIPPGNSRVRIIYIKNGGQILGRLPVVPGAAKQIDVPLPDDDPRLAAEARLAAMREDLVDVVARRNILMARARQRIEKGDFAEARKLLTAIDELPDRAQFNLTLTTAARALKSDDPQIQRRIDQLFQATQTVLAQYLDLKPISELHDELREAQKKATVPGN